MNILGINAYHGDASAVLISDGRLVAAVEEERIRRVKHCAGFPSEAIRACLAIAGITGKEIDHFAISRDPKAHLGRKFLYALRRKPDVSFLWDRLRNRSKVRGVVEEVARTLSLSPAHVRERFHDVEHHPAHLASTFYVSPFEEAAVCAIDGFGDFVSTSMAHGQGSALDVCARTYFPHSLGLLYLAFTQFLGFPSYGDEYKVMGLAPYGEPEYAAAIRKLVRLEKDGQVSLDMSYFRHGSEKVAMTWSDGAPTIDTVFTEELEKLLGPSREPHEEITTRHHSIAASLQRVFEQSAFHVLRALHARTGSKRLCLAGGCAMNSVANGKIRAETPFENVFIQPASADNGTALGAAYYVWHQVLKKPRGFTMEHGYWGTSFNDSSVLAALHGRDGELERACAAEQMCEPHALADWTAEKIAAGKVVGWFQGRMEWGARALGNRSILADPRRSNMRDILNAKIKRRESFRPFAPSILEERLHDYFEGAVPDPFMLHVYPVAKDKRDALPAVTHVDGSGRLQTVNREQNPIYHRLLEAFEKRSGVPVLLNTSFNENEPIVHEPQQAIDCFLRTDMDVLVLESHVLEKREAVAETRQAS